jgi:hypothetical protein
MKASANPATRFESTLPLGEPELMRASDYKLYLQDLEEQAVAQGVSSRISSLSPSLRADLYRFEADGGSSEVLEVVAACVRHAKRVTIHLQFEERVLPLTVFPEERLVHCPIPMAQFLAFELTKLSVMHVEPATLRPPGDPEAALVGEERLHSPLAPFLWELALRGNRSELLPEIAGPAVYRVTPGLDWKQLPVSGALLTAVKLLRRQSTNLRDISEWPGMDKERAIRLLNALYLQAGLMVSRSHPDAISESWFGGLGR